MATEYKLEVQKREQYGKKASKNLRKSGVIPGIYYSSDSKESISFAIEKAELRNATKSGARLYSVNVGGKARTVLFKNVQYHPVTDEILHIDLYGVKMDEAITVKTSIQLVGDSIGGLMISAPPCIASVLKSSSLLLPLKRSNKIHNRATIHPA